MAKPHVPLSVPAVPSLAAGSGASLGPGAPCARQRGRAAARLSVTHGTSPSLISCLVRGWAQPRAQRLQCLGAALPREGENAHCCGHQCFIWRFSSLWPLPFWQDFCLDFWSKEENLSQGGHQPDFLLFHQTLTAGSAMGTGGHGARSGVPQSGVKPEYPDLSGFPPAVLHVCGLALSPASLPLIYRKLEVPFLNKHLFIQQRT